MKGKIISIEGVDGSGKETQTKRLYERLKSEGHKVIRRAFPNYEGEASILVKMYLRGDFGQNAEDVNAYIASTFFAADRYASFKTDWEKYYNDGYIIILDRYTTANMVHQAGKIEDEKERDEFLNWLYNYEFGLYKLPVPDKTILLDVTMETRNMMTKGRKNKITGEEIQDIHEKDENHLIHARKASLYVAKKYHWNIVQCDDIKLGTLRSIESIGEEVYRLVKEIIK